jgi:hypothetical protein
MQALPTEMLLRIFEYSDLKTKVKFRQLNKQLSRLKIKHQFFRLVKSNCDNSRGVEREYDSVFKCLKFKAKDSTCYVAIGYVYENELFLINEFQLHYDCPCQFLDDSERESECESERDN